MPKATVVMSYSAEAKYMPKNYLAMDVLKGILDLVYTEKVREEEGGTYGVSVNAYVTVEARCESCSHGCIRM